jgi:Fe-S cluster biogenesis protein NfuA
MTVENILDKIEEVLDKKVRPKLAEHEGNITVVSFEDGILKFKLTGRCSGCPSADITTEMLIKEDLMAEFPEIRDVVLITGVSDDLLDEARKILAKKEI